MRIINRVIVVADGALFLSFFLFRCASPACGYVFYTRAHVCRESERIEGILQGPSWRFSPRAALVFRISLGPRHSRTR